MSQVELKEAQSSFVLLSRGASRKQLKLKTRCLTVGACGRESNLLRVRTHECGKKQNPVMIYRGKQDREAPGSIPRQKKKKSCSEISPLIIETLIDSC